MFLYLALPEKKTISENHKLMKRQTFKRIGSHILFWLFYVLFFGLFYGKYGHDYRLHLIETACMMPFVMMATYITIYGILPYYLKTRRPLLTIVPAVIVLFLITLGERMFLRWLNHLPITSGSLIGVTFLYLMLETNFMVGLAVVIKFLKIWFDQQQEKYEMEKKHLESELNVLKAQLHPHFLFNTMNNLYALSLEKSSLTSKGIAKISDLLRSVLYECNDPEISLAKEIRLIKNYIDLEKMRYGSRLDVNFRIKGEVEHFMIAPMILFTFVENSFKHGSSNDAENPYIDIDLLLRGKEIRFKAENSKPQKTVQRKENKTGGLGLVNVKKRLEIIYPGKYELNYCDKDSSYIVDLRIWN